MDKPILNMSVSDNAPDGSEWRELDINYKNAAGAKRSARAKLNDDWGFFANEYDVVIAPHLVGFAAYYREA